MRSFRTAFSEEFLQSYQAGVLRYSYRGVRCLKSPLDLAIYARAIWDLKPRTIIEIGTHSGGSALWLADLVQTYGLSTRVCTIDVKLPELRDDRISFIEGDVMNLAAAFAAAGLGDSPHPWFVSEDSAHTFEGCLVALGFLAGQMAAGDILCMEDGVLDELGLSEKYSGGPNRAIAKFLGDHPDLFQVDLALCDMFGPNATYAPNGYLRKR